jgi:phospholipase C
MPNLDRRALLAALGALSLPPALARAAAIDADVRTGTIQDVEHVVILMQENRSFDHYFGTMNGVQGFGDRFVIPAPATPTHANRTTSPAAVSSPCVTPAGTHTTSPARTTTRRAPIVHVALPSTTCPNS